MKNQVRWLRASYFIGAAVDAVAAVGMLVPAVMAAAYGLSELHPGPEATFALRLGASLMLGWTVLLIWAAQRPVERKGVLLITVCPVLVGLAAAQVFAVQAGLVAAGGMAASWAVQAGLASLFLFAYWEARPDRSPSPDLSL